MVPRAYIAGVGMVTPLGINFPMTASAIKAGISGYTVSDYLAEDGQPVTMSMVPDEFFDSVSLEIDEGDYFGVQHERVAKMAVVALKEAIVPLKVQKALPLILTFPEEQHTYPESLKTNLLAQKDLPLSGELMYSFYTGRSGGVEAIGMALRYLHDLGHPYVVIGASDSFYQCPRLVELKERQRLLTATNSDGFAPGEAAAFIVLTRDKSKALVSSDGKAIGLYEPGISHEEGPIYSDAAYLGEGLDKAVSQALTASGLSNVDMIYSCMNGERYWSKELGVTMMRSLRGTKDGFKIEHPADCYGDVGAASGSMLLGLAVADLLKDAKTSSGVVYSSSDSSNRAAIVLQKI